jgi:solute carrier family 32 (vesicular inhibitory amino acid transporter)
MFSLLGGLLANNASQYMLIAAALMIPTVWMPNLSALSFLGVFGVMATCTVVASVSFLRQLDLVSWLHGQLARI